MKNLSWYTVRDVIGVVRPGTCFLCDGGLWEVQDVAYNEIIATDCNGELLYLWPDSKARVALVSITALYIVDVGKGPVILVR